MNNQSENYAFKRILAEMIDVILFYFICSIPLIISTTLITIISTTMKGNSPLPTIILFVGFISFPVTFIYLNIRQIENKSATWGYRIVGLILVNSDGLKFTYMKLLLRSIIKMLFIPLYFLWIPALIHILIIINSNGENDLIDRLFKTKAIYKI